MYDILIYTQHEQAQQSRTSYSGMFGGKFDATAIPISQECNGYAHTYAIDMVRQAHNITMR